MTFTAGASPAAAPDRPLAGLTFALAGAGRVGSSLARWAAAAGARAVAVAVHRADPGLAHELGAEAVPFERFTSDGCDLLLVAVADPALDAVAAALDRRTQAAVALHTAGSRGAGALAPLRAAGSAVGTLHPLLAFPGPLPPAAARGAVIGIGGDPPAERLATRLAEAWGAVPVTVPEDRRLLYHLAASLAAGGAVTLVATAAALAARLGLPPAVAAGYLQLARGALAAVDPLSPGAAITGPAARGDTATVERQLAALTEADPDLVPLVRALTAETRRRVAGR